MHDRLLEQISHWNNEFLLEQYLGHREQYTEAARKTFEEEIARRGITAQEQAAAAALHETTEASSPTISELKREEGVALPHPLLLSEGALAAHLLQEAQVLFLMTTPNDSPASKQVSLLVRPEDQGRAEELLAQHFKLKDGVLRIQFSDRHERLKSFDPAGAAAVALGDAELELNMSDSERQEISKLGRRLLDEVDAVEKAQERVVFYYDNLETVIGKLDSRGPANLNAGDCMTILEILQIYCDDPAFPESLWEGAGALLDCVAELTS